MIQIFRGVELAGCAIIEYHPDERRTGSIVYSGLNSDGTFGVGWSDPNSRTTLFDPRSWTVRKEERDYVLERIGPDFQDFDVPPKEVSKYRIMPDVGLMV